MDLNIVSFGYLFLRLAPFILVCFFTLASIFNQDYKGLVYLVGLLFACFITTMLGKLLSFNSPIVSNEICNMITVGQNANISPLPLGQCVFSYTFFYLLFVIVKYKFVTQNIPTIVFFPVLMVFDMVWNIRNGCAQFLPLIAAIIFGGCSGLLWAYIIDSTNSKSLQYFIGVNNNETCSVPSTSTFRCMVYKNGKMISNNISG